MNREEKIDAWDGLIQRIIRVDRDSLANGLPFLAGWIRSKMEYAPVINESIMREAFEATVDYLEES